MCVALAQTFQRLSIHGDLKVEDRLNDKKIPEDVALLDRPAQELSGFRVCCVLTLMTVSIGFLS